MKIGKTATQKYLSVECDANRIFGLDLLRAFAIFFVVHGHGAFLLSDTKLAPLTNNPFRYEVEIYNHDSEYFYTVL